MKVEKALSEIAFILHDSVNRENQTLIIVRN